MPATGWKTGHFFMMERKVETGNRTITEAEEITTLMPEIWEAEHEQLGAGRFKAHYRFAFSPDAFASEETFDTRERVVGALAEGLIAFAFACPSAREGGRWWGSDHPANGIPFGNGGTELDLVLPADHHRSVVVFERERFHSLFVDLAGYDPDFLDLQSVFLQSAETDGESFRERLNREILRAEQSPAGLAPEQFSQNLAEILVDSLHHSRDARPTNGRTGALVRRAISMAEDRDFRLSMLGLCRELRCGKRTLEYAFRDQLDLSPSDYLRTRRFDTARRELLAADPEGTTVKDLAERLGFQALGHFASQYRSRFGEYPTETLRRVEHTRVKPIAWRA